VSELSCVETMMVLLRLIVLSSTISFNFLQLPLCHLLVLPSCPLQIVPLSSLLFLFELSLFRHLRTSILQSPRESVSVSSSTSEQLSMKGFLLSESALALSIQSSGVKCCRKAGIFELMFCIRAMGKGWSTVS